MKTVTPRFGRIVTSYGSDYRIFDGVKMMALRNIKGLPHKEFSLKEGQKLLVKSGSHVIANEDGVSRVVLFRKDGEVIGPLDFRVVEGPRPEQQVRLKCFGMTIFGAVIAYLGITGDVFRALDAKSAEVLATTGSTLPLSFETLGGILAVCGFLFFILGSIKFGEAINTGRIDTEVRHKHDIVTITGTNPYIISA